MNTKALGIIFSNIHDKELEPLTHSRTIGSVPICGRYRLIDFALSNMVNTGITKVGVVTKEHYQSLIAHIGSGKSWDLARKNGGLVLLPPFASYQTRLYKSRLDALIHIEHFIQKSIEPFIVLSDCDSVCNINYLPYLNRHIANNADITVLYNKKPPSKTCKNLFLTLDKTNRIIKSSLKSTVNTPSNIFANIVIISKSVLLNCIKLGKEEGLTSFSKDVLSRTKAFRIFGEKINDIFMPIESLLGYYNVNMALLDENIRDNLFYNGRPIFTKVQDTSPFLATKSAIIKNSLIADGCTVEGDVENSILFRGCFIAKGAKVKNSVLFEGTQIKENSNLNYIICDNDVKIGKNITLSGHFNYPHYVARNTVI